MKKIYKILFALGAIASVSSVAYANTTFTSFINALPIKPVPAAADLLYLNDFSGGMVDKATTFGDFISAIGNVSGFSTTSANYWAAVASPLTIGKLAVTSLATSSIPNQSGIIYTQALATTTNPDYGFLTNLAYSLLPATGGEIVEPPGELDYLTPIVFNVANKVVYLKGSGISGESAFYPTTNGGTILFYNSSSGNAITVDTNYSSGGSKIEDLSVMGSNGTTARSTIGIKLGDSVGAFSTILEHVGISGFGTGLSIGYQTSFDTIDNSVINGNGRDIDEPNAGGASGENIRVTNSVIADSNNQAGGATDLYCIYSTLSGNVQWSFVNDSIDDCQVYFNQFGGTANVWTFTNDHFENPNGHIYDFVQTLTNVPASELTFVGGDLMNDVVGGQSEFMTIGGDVSFNGTTIDGNNNVTTPSTRVVNFANATNAATVSWEGIKNNGNGAKYIYGTVLFSPWGYGTGLPLGPSFYISSTTASTNGNVGFGTSTPIAVLDSFTPATTTPNLLLEASTTGGCFIMRDSKPGAPAYTEFYSEAGTLVGKVAASPYICN